MGKSGKKARKKSLDPRRVEAGAGGGGASKKKESDWSFEDICRSKGRGR